MITKYLIVFLISMVPLIELRGDRFPIDTGTQISKVSVSVIDWKTE